MKSQEKQKKIKVREAKNLLKARDFCSYSISKAGTTYNSQCVLNVQINFLKSKVIIILLIIICSNCHRQGQGKLVFGLGKVREISETFFCMLYFR